MRLRNLFLTFTALVCLGAFPATDAHAKASAAVKKNRKVVTYSGKISGLKNGKDRKKKRYWEYRLRTASGETVIVHDYQYGKYRQPAGMGIAEGAKRKVRGFFVHISTKLGSSKKEPVLIVSPAN
ncbi:MAG: hypothetical protein JST04_09995 [Bdellovibrionales bacterium]|nr:hypothetical protein [Bdellovibrionales bacterium]